MSSRSLVAAAGAALLLTGLVVAACLPVGLELEVAPALSDGGPLLVVRLPRGEPLTLRYVHSVSGRPVREVHSIDARGRIFVEEERFSALSAGMGYWPGRGRLGQAGTEVTITGIHARVDPFLLRVGRPGVDHTLIWPGGRADLTAMASGELVRIAAHPITPLRQIWRMARRLARGRVAPPLPRPSVTGRRPEKSREDCGDAEQNG